jgi:subtilisin family serine protease
MSSIFSTDELGNSYNGDLTQHANNFEISATAYNLDAGKSSVSSSAIYSQSHLLANDLESNTGRNSDILTTHLGQSYPANFQADEIQQRSSDTDEITGLNKTDHFLDTNIASIESETFVGKLEWGDDYHNPTRLSTLKDDYLLLEQEAKNVKLDLSSSNFDTYLQLVDAKTGILLNENDDSAIDNAQVRNSQLNFTAQPGKEYVIRVTSSTVWTRGDYSLTVTTDSSSESNVPNSFSNTHGYGLIDAATAVATAVGKSRFSDVADIGGNQWNNDMVNAPESWAQGYTGEGVTVAVIDSGVDINHSDLRDSIWENTDEILGDGIDNDNNGYIDDRYGWNFGIGQNNNNVTPGTFIVAQDHGTHVAGTIAAANDGIGTTGVAYNANIMPIRLGDVSFAGKFTNPGNLSQAIRYAVDNGANVINMSIAWDDPDGSVRSALDYAASRNVIAVMAAGNNSKPSPNIPASYATEYGISVGSVASDGRISSFSHRAGTDSRMHHVMAPGEGIYSSGFLGKWWSKSGTSMATPHVAGVVALMLDANPNLTHAQVREILTGKTSFTTAAVSNSVSSSVSNSVLATSVGTAEVSISEVSSNPWDSFHAGVSTLRPALSDHKIVAALYEVEDLVEISSTLADIKATEMPEFVSKNSQMLDFVYSDDWRFQLPQPLSDELLAPMVA